jgi:hypothetical protein
MPKRHKPDRSAGKTGGVAYVHRDERGQLTDDQPEIGKSIATDRHIDAERETPKGMKPRAD